MSTDKYSMQTAINKNYLSTLNYSFDVKKLSHVKYFLQRANIPGISLQNWRQPTPRLSIPVHGDHVDYEPLEITFKVDEELENYREIHNWIIGQGAPVEAEQHAALKAKNQIGEGLEVDISLTVLSSSKRPIFELPFYGAFPTQLSGIEFMTDENDVPFPVAHTTFQYYRYEIIKITA